MVCLGWDKYRHLPNRYRCKYRSNPMTTDQQQLTELVDSFKQTGGINKILPKDTMYLHGSLMVYVELRYGMDWVSLPDSVALTLVTKAAEDWLRGKGYSPMARWGYYCNYRREQEILSLPAAIRAEMGRKTTPSTPNLQ